jgi:hypothetical protein
MDIISIFYAVFLGWRGCDYFSFYAPGYIYSFLEDEPSLLSVCYDSESERVIYKFTRFEKSGGVTLS